MHASRRQHQLQISHSPGEHEVDVLQILQLRVTCAAGQRLRTGDGGPPASQKGGGEGLVPMSTSWPGSAAVNNEFLAAAQRTS